jgi:predicted transcriptional regulator
MHKQDQQDVSEMLKALIATGFTEEAIAKGIFVSQSTVSRMISGKASPRYVTSKRIEDIFSRFAKIDNM